MMRDGPILLVGSPRDPTFGHTVAALRRQQLDPTVLDMDRFCLAGSIEGSLANPESLVISDGGFRSELGRFRSCYARFIDLPIGWESDRAASWGRYRALQLAIGALDILVVNRLGAGESNNSKPFQTSLLQQHGFSVPRSCSTSMPTMADAFVRSCPDGAIYKSNSGERSIVQAVAEADWDRFSLLPSCPVFFQERIWGPDLRVHVVRNRCHGVRILSSAVDYRYDESGDASEEPFPVPKELAARCVAVTAAFGLEFSGIDLIQSDRDGSFVCLEVNPMPGYHGYDLSLSYEISESLGALLAEGWRDWRVPYRSTSQRRNLAS